MKKFWNWSKRTVAALDTGEPVEEERILTLDGVIAADSWWDDEISPAIFREELNQGTGPISVWINSPGGDVFAAAQIYNMLKEYKGKVTIKIDSLAASAATVISMAGDEVLMSPVGMFMIHNPWTVAQGDSNDLQGVIAELEAIEESLINAYEMKTGLSRREIAKLMDNETWMNANEALEKGFIDGILYANDESASARFMAPAAAFAYSPKQVACSVWNKVAAKVQMQSAQQNTSEPEPTPEPEALDTQPIEPQGRSVDDLMERLRLLEYNF